MASSVGQFCIAVSDLERSVRFYTEIMGLEEQGRTEIHLPHWQGVEQQQRQLLELIADGVVQRYS